MSDGLRSLLRLPEAKRAKTTAQAEEFGQAFREGMAGINRSLQVMAAQAGRTEYQPLEVQRTRLFDAFQKVSAQIDPVDPAKADPAIQRVLAAVTAVEEKVLALAEGARGGRDQWLKKEADFEDAMLQIGELEEAGHPKAAALRKLGGAIRSRANCGKYQESVAALGQLRPKLDQINAENRRQTDGDASVGADEPASDDVEAVDDAPREGLSVLVKDQETGDAIEGAAVTVGDQSDVTSSLGLATVELPVGRHDYQASAEGFGSVRDTVAIIEGDNPELVIEIATGAGAKEGLTVLLRDQQTGDVIEGVAVTVGDQSDVTSSNGLATVELPVGEHDYEALVDGYETVTGSVLIIEGDNPELVIELTQDRECEHATLGVLVADADTSEGIPGASVMIGEKTEDTSGVGLSVLTMEPGSYDYEVFANGYSTETGTVEVLEGDDNELSVRLTKEVSDAIVTFTVTEKESSDPVEGAAITLGEQTGKTDSAGVFEFQVEAGGLSYVVKKEGFEDASSTVETEAETNTDEYVELEKGPVWNPPSESEQPTLREGDESADGWVEFLQALLRHAYGTEILRGASGDAGSFDGETKEWVLRFQQEEGLLVDGIVGNQTWAALRNAAPRDPGTDGREPHSHVEHGAEARWYTEDSESSGYWEPDDFVELPAAISIGSEPVDDYEATVRVTSSDGSDTLSFKLGPPSKTTKSGDASTHYVRISNFRATYGAGTHKVEAYLPQELGGDLWSGEVEVPDGGGGGGGGEPPLTETATLEVHTLRTNGAPIDGATVRVSTGPTSPPDGTSDANGVVRFQLEPGEYHVNAAKRALVWQPGHVKQGSLVPGQTFTIRLADFASGRLSVRVLRGGSPEEGATVTVTPGAHAPLQTNAGGNADFFLPEGAFQVAAISADGESSGTGTATVKAESDAEAVIELDGRGGGGPPIEFSAGLTVMVEGEGNVFSGPLEGAKVHVFENWAPNRVHSATTNASGNASFQLSLGTEHERSYNVEAHPPAGTDYTPAAYGGNPITIRGGETPALWMKLTVPPDWDESS